MSETNSKLKPPSVPAVVQAVQVLRCLAASSRSLNVTGVARETGISQSSCFNVLRTLARERLVNFDSDSKTYRLGLGILEIACRVQGLSEAEMIRPELATIARTYNALLTLWEIVDNTRMVLIDRVAADAALRIEVRIGQRLPAFAGAVGRSVAAALNLPASQLRRQFDKLVWQSDPSFEAYARDIEQARIDGYAIDIGNWVRGVTVLGTAVLDGQGKPRMAIGALTLTGQLTEEELQALGQALHETGLMVGRVWFPGHAQENTKAGEGIHLPKKALAAKSA